MKYNLANAAEAGRALAYLAELVNKGALVEVLKVSPKRSLNQNAYLHLLLGAFGNHFGYTVDEAKLIYKEINADIYKYEKDIRGKHWEFYRSSSKVTKEEMAKSIDRLMQESARAGYPLPPATDKGWLMQIENEIERSNYYL